MEFDLSKPYADSKSFDLAICLEVAEHLPVNAADAIVESLTRLAPIVLFSAAIPHQGGVNHINEQWLEYWRDRFAAKEFELVNCLRSQLWEDPRVGGFYAQNLVLFVARSRLAVDDRLRLLRDEAAH